MAAFPQSRIIPGPSFPVEIPNLIQQGLAVAATTIYALISARRPSVGSITFDCTLQETHGWENNLPGVPVQRNVTESDTIIRRPDRLTMLAVISDLATSFKDQYAMSALASLYDHRERFSSLSNRETAWARLQALDRTHEPFDIYTDLALYPEMVFESVQFVEQRASDMVIRISAKKFEQVNVRIQNYLGPLIEDVGDEAEDVGTSGAVEATGTSAEADPTSLGATG